MHDVANPYRSSSRLASSLRLLFRILRWPFANSETQSGHNNRVQRRDWPRDPTRASASLHCLLPLSSPPPTSHVPFLPSLVSSNCGKRYVEGYAEKPRTFRWFARATFILGSGKRDWNLSSSESVILRFIIVNLKWYKISESRSRATYRFANVRISSFGHCSFLQILSPNSTYYVSLCSYSFLLRKCNYILITSPHNIRN